MSRHQRRLLVCGRASSAVRAVWEGGLGEDWVPRELRHTFVSIMSAGGVPVEEIARLAGHQQSSTTELVYRRELGPVSTTGAEIMDRIFS